MKVITIIERIKAEAQRRIVPLEHPNADGTVSKERRATTVLKFPAVPDGVQVVPLLANPSDTSEQIWLLITPPQNLVAALAVGEPLTLDQAADLAAEWGRPGIAQVITGQIRGSLYQPEVEE